MTREEAIKWIKYHINTTPYEQDDEMLKALEMAIKALEQEPKVTTSTDEPMVMQYPQVDGITPTVVNAEQEPCDDVVSRQAVLNEFYDVENLYERIKQLPPVRPQPKIGHWIEKDNYLYVCSECGKYIYSEIEHNLLEFHAFCGRCGARMVEPQESE